MTTLGDQLKKHFPPKPREIWLVKDKQIRLTDEDRDDKGQRPVLVLYNAASFKPPYKSINIIPISRSGEPDKVSIPIARGVQLEPDCDIDINSLAVVTFYQPIYIDYFVKKIGVLDEVCYNVILETLQREIIGISTFDLEMD